MTSFFYHVSVLLLLFGALSELDSSRVQIIAIVGIVKMESASQNGLISSQGDSRPAYNEMTSRDYYFDSYAHFGIHEV